MVNTTSSDNTGDLRARLDFDDSRLLAECEVHVFRASGPGGQHRNKTSSAVRLRHRLSNLTAKAVESRSQHQNKARALRRLREVLAVQIRRPLPETIEWPEHMNVANGRLKMASNNPSVCHVIGLILDALHAYDGKLPAAAARLGISASSLTRFLSEHHAAWAEANRIRAAAGLSPLRA